MQGVKHEYVGGKIDAYITKRVLVQQQLCSVNTKESISSAATMQREATQSQVEPLTSTLGGRALCGVRQPIAAVPLHRYMSQQPTVHVSYV